MCVYIRQYNSNDNYTVISLISLFLFHLNKSFLSQSMRFFNLFLCLFVSLFSLSSHLVEDGVSKDLCGVQLLA